MDKRKFYDEAFAEVFTNDKIIRSLLKDFVNEPWIGEIDFSTMEITKSVFKGISDSKRESDILLRFKMDDGELYIFLLLEFQSKPEAMILRLLEYLLRVYKRQREELGTMYPVVPFVIYNGEEKWGEECRFARNLLGCTPELDKYIPDFRYILIDIARFDETLLENLKDAVSYFFLLDKTDLRKRDSAATRVVDILRKLYRSDREIYQLLGRYISGLMEYRGLEIHEIYDYIDDRSESMLAQSLDELYEEGREKGRSEGRREGREEGLDLGRSRGKAEMLIRQLESKFGITEEQKQLVLNCPNPDAVDDALNIILFARTLQDVLEGFY